MKNAVPGILALGAAVTVATACRTVSRDGSSAVKDSSIVTTAPDDQRATAFCWAYALVAHLEQRYYETTRGATRGGFRINLSEEYLALLQMMDQLIEGKDVSEGLRLAESLALVDRYGIVPEKIGTRLLFRAKFEESLAPKVLLAAQMHWAEAGQAENTPLAPAQALNLVMESAELSADQKKFLSGAVATAHQGDAAFNGIGNPADARFSYAETTHTPLTWARDGLKFAAKNYYVIRFPDSGRGQQNDAPYAPEYETALKLVKKALLYGYSVPISFNIVDGSTSDGGVLGCRERGCSDATLSSPTPSWPHANHAVILVDYRSAATRLEAPTEASLQQGFAQPPVEWVMKNSWGFNGNTSSNPALLRRFPLPAYTLMTQDFFEASHKLRPGRYEAIVPRNVCMHDLTAQRPWRCEPLVVSDDSAGTPTAEQARLALDTSLIIGNVNRAATSRYPVEMQAGVAELPETSPVLKLVDVTRPPPDELAQVSLRRRTPVTPDPGAQSFRLCGKVEAGPTVKYVALYLEGQRTPSAVLSPQGNWEHCVVVAVAPQRSFKLLLQGLNDHQRVVGQITATVDVAAAR